MEGEKIKQKRDEQAEKEVLKQKSLPSKPFQDLAKLEESRSLEVHERKTKPSLMKPTGIEPSRLGILPSDEGITVGKQTNEVFIQGSVSEVMAAMDALSRKANQHGLTDHRPEEAISRAQAPKDAKKYITSVNKLNDGGGPGADEVIAIEQYGVEERSGVKGFSAAEFLKNVYEADPAIYNQTKLLIAVRDEAEKQEVIQNFTNQDELSQHKQRVVIKTIEEVEATPAPQNEWRMLVRIIDKDLPRTAIVMHEGGFEQTFAEVHFQKKDLKDNQGQALDEGGIHNFLDGIQQGNLADLDLHPESLKNTKWSLIHKPIQAVDKYHPLSFSTGDTTIGSFLKKSAPKGKRIPVYINTGLLERTALAASRLSVGGMIEIIGHSSSEASADPEKSFLDPDGRLREQLSIPINFGLIQKLFGGDLKFEYQDEEIPLKEAKESTQKYHPDIEHTTLEQPLHRLQLEKTQQSQAPQPLTSKSPTHPSPTSTPIQSSATPIQESSAAVDDLDNVELIRETPPPTQAPKSSTPTQIHGASGISTQNSYRPKEHIPSPNWWDMVTEKDWKTAMWYYDNVKIRGTYMIIGKLIPIAPYRKKRKKRKLDWEELIDIYAGLELQDLFGEM